jgi:hypothetical protein
MSLPTGCAGFSIVRTTSISPFPGRSSDHALGASILLVSSIPMWESTVQANHNQTNA